MICHTQRMVINIRYAIMRSMDISNGRGIGVSLFVQGCRAHCKGCFNAETWCFDGGKEWTDETKQTFLRLASKSYVVRISILGGEPFEPENLDDVIDLLKTVKKMYPDKEVWVYTGHNFDDVMCSDERFALPYIDVLVDGRFVEELKDISLKWCGSSNQHVIDVQKTLATGDMVLYNS